MPGKIGKYKVIRTLGEGSTCKVKLAIDETNGNKVAIKIMNSDLDEKMRELIMVEVQAMSKLKHANIIEQMEVGTALYEKPKGNNKMVSYIVMESAQGGELFDFIANSGTFTEAEARYFFKQFMQGLDYCHNQ